MSENMIGVALLLLTGLIGPALPQMVKGFDPCLKVDLGSLSHGGFAKEPDKSRPLLRKEGAVKKETPPLAREPATLSAITQDKDNRNNSRIFHERKMSCHAFAHFIPYSIGCLDNPDCAFVHKNPALLVFDQDQPY